MRYEIITGNSISDLKINVENFLLSNPSFYCVGGVFIENSIFYQTFYTN